MQKNISVVSLPDGRQTVVNTWEIEDGCIKVREYYEDEEYGTNYHHIDVPVEIDQTYLLSIQAQMCIDLADKDKHAVMAPIGGMGINHLAYFYSVCIVETGKRIYVGITEPKYTASGVAQTDFDMYAYHDHQSLPKMVYDNFRLEYEVEQRLDLNTILLGEQAV